MHIENLQDYHLQYTQSSYSQLLLAIQWLKETRAIFEKTQRSQSSNLGLALSNLSENQESKVDAETLFELELTLRTLDAS